MGGLNFKNIKKRYIFLAALVIPFIPVMLIFIVCMGVKYGTGIINTRELIIDTSSPIKIGDYLYYYFTIAGIGLTAILSYAIWRTSVKSTNLAKAINDKEENRDKENIKESALILYYDLIFKISILKELFSQKPFKNRVQEVKKLIVTSDWMKHIVALRNILDRQELYTLIDLYNSFLSLHYLIDSDNEVHAELDDLVNNLANKVFIGGILDYLWMDFSGEIESTLSSQYFMVYRKIQAVINEQLNSEFIRRLPSGEVEVNRYRGHIKYIGEFKGGKLKNGTDQWSNEYGHISYLFKYEDYRIVEGYFRIKMDEIDNLIFNSNFDNKGKQSTGYTTIYYDSKNIKYKGEIVDGKYEGEGDQYFDNRIPTLQFSGRWKDGKKLRGEYTNKFSNGIKYFRGEYKNNTPYSGEIEVGDTYKFIGAYGFKGIINEGKLIKGNGYMYNRNYFDEEFLNKHQEYDEQDNNYNIVYEHEEIPEEIQQEMQEDSIRSENESSRDTLLNSCGQVVELLAATWMDGECTLYPDDLLYKKYFGLHTKDC